MVFLLMLPSGEQGESNIRKAQENWEKPKMTDNRELSESEEGRVLGSTGRRGRRNERQRVASTRTVAAVAPSASSGWCQGSPPRNLPASEASVLITHLTGQRRAANEDMAVAGTEQACAHLRPCCCPDEQPASQAPSLRVSEPRTCLKCHCSHGSLDS